MYAATTMSVTCPLLQQKYPRAHRWRPQNCFRNGANSCSILYAVFPFRRCTRRLIVTCGGNRHLQVHVVLADVALQDMHIQLAADLPDQFPDPKADWTDQHRLAVLRHPHQVQVDLEHAVGPMAILAHGAHSNATER